MSPRRRPAFVTYTEAVYAARTLAVSSGATTVRSRHGLTFVPRATLADAPQLDRLLVPGAAAAARHDASTTHDLRPADLHAAPGFAFDGPLRDSSSNRRGCAADRSLRRRDGG
ncbi:hypothetical protein [Micromonospora sp. NPDC006431]|uniref:hypothetical protein n=1 Tax=Micromonospora sp. NPDC006431 TaxID=3364235 RepID=UPI0036886371